MSRVARAVIVGSVLAAFWPAVVGAQGVIVPDLQAVSLEDLMNLEVTSVSRREQPLSQAPSAIHVISREDIRRSGATSLPELLRLVPGLHVARIDGNKWAISARGFNNRFANKMLVLIDGRSVYTPLFSGVYWDLQDTLLDDVERVEVIRGPGATVWGANAVNGVINVITRDAAQTQGGAVTFTAGTLDRPVTGVRYGGRMGEHAHYRVYGKFSDRQALTLNSGALAADGSDRVQAGARVDWKPGARDSVMFTGDVHRGSAGQTLSTVGVLAITTTAVERDTRSSGANLLGRWTRELSPQSDFTLQLYYDDVRRDDVLVAQHQRTLDVDAQQHFAARGHEVVWGLGYRRNTDVLEDSPYLTFTPGSRAVDLFSVFLQDEVTLVPQQLRATLGTKVEHNAYTGWEVQPNVRLAYTPRASHTIWASSSRAVRTPSRAESDVRIDFAPVPSPRPMPFPMQPAMLGNPYFRAEVLRAYEAGWRIVPAPTVSIDIAAFANDYDRLRTFEPESPFLERAARGPRIVVPLRFGNLMTGATKGVEVLASWAPVTRWRMVGSWSHIDVDLRHAPSSADTIAIRVEDDSPRHQVQAQSYLTLARGWELDVAYFGVGRLEKQMVPGYHRADVRLGWQPAARVSVSLGLQNLGTGKHREFGSSLGETPTYVPRTAYARVIWQF